MAIFRSADTLGNCSCVVLDIRAGKLQEVLANYQALEISIYAVYPERRHLSPKVRAFVDFMAKLFLDPQRGNKSNKLGIVNFSWRTA